MWGHWEAGTTGNITVTPTRGAVMSHLLSQSFTTKKHAAVVGWL